jgi:hypothetical protein
VIYLCIFNRCSVLTGSIAGAKLDRCSSESPVYEHNRVLPCVSKCRIEGVWGACGHTAALHACACNCGREIETLWAMDVSGAVNAAPLCGREIQVWLEVKLSTRNPFDDQHGAGADGTMQQVCCFGAICARNCADADFAVPMS